MSYESICTELPLLTRKQLDDIRKRCSLLMQQQSAKGNSVEEADWILEGILYECQRRGVYVGRGFHLKNRSGSSFAGFATKSVELREILTKCAPGMSPVQYVALGQICARELARYLEGAPLKILMGHLEESLAKTPLSRPQRAGIIQTCIEEISDYQGVGLSFKRMMDRVDLIPTALEKAYPGYMASKLLQLTVPYDGE